MRWNSKRWIFAEHSAKITLKNNNNKIKFRRKIKQNLVIVKKNYIGLYTYSFLRHIFRFVVIIFLRYFSRILQQSELLKKYRNIHHILFVKLESCNQTSTDFLGKPIFLQSNNLQSTIVKCSKNYCLKLLINTKYTDYGCRNNL